MRIATLDLMRFFAAISVVLYHYISRPESTIFPGLAEFTKFGYLGVPIFFMISGYVISLSAENRSAYKFAVSRFVRLYPALWFSVIFTVIVVSFTGDRSFSYTQVLANLTLLNDYMGIGNIDGVYWTLQAEIKFYACVFFLVLTGLFSRYKLWLSIWLASTCAHFFINQPFFMGWFISPGYSPYFIVGVSFYLIQKKGFDSYNVAVLLISATLCACQAFTQAEGYIADWVKNDSLIASIIVLIAIIFFIGVAKNYVSFKGGRFAYVLGALTYPLYLLHNSAGKSIIDSDALSSFKQEQVVIVVILLMLSLSYIVFRFVELPVSKALKLMLTNSNTSLKPKASL